MPRREYPYITEAPADQLGDDWHICRGIPYITRGTPTKLMPGTIGGGIPYITSDIHRRFRCLAIGEVSRKNYSGVQGILLISRSYPTRKLALKVI
ncbi:hypothetical protein FNV43_RR04361 [Rhamnella rubrinervis]|uniref:Uncharacterized protein n=1 Tax=Rhamnella rubrinervis TaxID=2594499 RepID=A0A8K0MQI4_9ROSA|nr:hypothetical protein FNV43_RR04361 [Rhamnella rubrinervis]